MSNEIFANGMEIAGKASTGKSVAAFPDVCFTPAPPPPGVPIPYPNTGLASDCAEGSKSVTISGKEAHLKNKSYFKTSTGDEAGSAPKKGIVTSTHKGKVYFASWSMDVKIEGENVVRHLDLTTHNHGSMPGNTPAWPFLGKRSQAAHEKCSSDKDKTTAACGGEKATKAERCASESCRTAMRCELQPFKRNRQTGCCTGQTAHHIIEVHGFTPAGKRGARSRLPGFSKYDDQLAPCVCCDESSRWKGDHGSLHAVQGMAERAMMDPDGPRSQMGGLDNAWTYKEAKKGGLAAHRATFPSSGCSDDCIEVQLDAYHRRCGVTNGTVLRADRAGLSESQEEFGKKVMDEQERDSLF